MPSGGPGVGPIGVGAHLAPFLPGHRLLEAEGSPRTGGVVCSAPFGTAWFFSCRIAAVPFVLRIWELLVIIGDTNWDNPEYEITFWILVIDLP